MSAESEYVSSAIEDGVALLTLERPESLNAYTPEMGWELVRAIDRTDGDDAVRAIVLTGRGKAFCAGADLKTGIEVFQRGGPGGFVMERDADTAGVVARRFLDSRKPIVTAFNGAAIGVGVTAALATDIRIASSTAKFGLPFLKLGIVPEGASSWLLPRVVGMGRAMEWILTGRIFDAEEALSAGLVTSVVPPEELLPTALETASSLARSNSPVATAITRRMMWEMLQHGDARTAHELDSRGIYALGMSAEAEEGIQALLEKRPADFPLQVSTDLPPYFHRWSAAGSAHAYLDSPEALEYPGWKTPGG